MTLLSLRARLALIILLPLLAIAAALGVWAYRDAVERAADRFDRSLLSTALAISRDTALSGGDALSESTRDLLRDTSGGPVFYHVFAPDGVYVTGYATPPVPPAHSGQPTDSSGYYDSVYQGRPVRAFRFTDVMTVDGLNGDFTFTVWQGLALRDGFVASLSQRTFVVIASLVTALAMIVWFGVRFGLRPLVDLESAIARRSSSDLAPIQRPIPVEVRGIVATLNRLLADLAETIRRKDDFVSDAAHQLRNPIAGVLTLAESLESAPTAAERRERTAALSEATRDLARLADGLLALERARTGAALRHEAVDLVALLTPAVGRFREICTDAGVSFDTNLPEQAIRVRIDPLLVDQALVNLVRNAILHGGPALTQVRLSVRQEGDWAEIEVADDGRGLAEDEIPVALSRFGQVRPAAGSGLGLSIVQAVAESSGGDLAVSGEGGLKVVIRLPILSAGDDAPVLEI